MTVSKTAEEGSIPSTPVKELEYWLQYSSSFNIIHNNELLKKSFQMLMSLTSGSFLVKLNILMVYQEGILEFQEVMAC